MSSTRIDHEIPVSPVSAKKIRLGAVAAIAALAMGAAAPMASATEARHARVAQQTESVRELATAVSELDAPPIVEEGLDERAAALPANRTLPQILEAMYPGDQAAQAQVLAVLTGQTDTAEPVETQQPASPGSPVVAFSPWGKAWKYTKCVAYVTAAFVPGAAAYKAIKALGGVKTTAKLLIKAGNSDDFLKLAGGSASEIIGVKGIRDNCF
ncbi:hypothetical protein [Streptomyces sp. BPTC-684]|uniref:hypothetical protein n=1 Tax=Streptomyces sp. BPTC-684 TaxID=3043734 RepID=UPI0024B1AAA2|nr:hypothetical protein [Streptomyces sp. BPTC-684]WHM38260.1 hypothetical protein QIY60_15930 [Streptomyces sp. BPTC-684]